MQQLTLCMYSCKTYKFYLCLAHNCTCTVHVFIVIFITFSSTVTIEDSPNKINVMDALTILQQTDEPGPPQEIDTIGKLYSLFKTIL